MSAPQVDRGRAVGLAGLVTAGAALGAFLLWLASRAQLGNDELFTLYFAGLPTLGDVWRELGTGVEQTPPLFYIVTRASLAVLGDGPVALRLPEIVGVLGAAGCVAAAVTRRASLLTGAVAALLLLVTQATFYAVEARPYGLALGLVAAAYLLWQLRLDGRGGGLLVAGLALALAAAVGMHYYAVLALLPFAVGEAWRRRATGRIDRGVATALGVSLVPLVFALPLIDAARAYSGSFWTEFGWRDAIDLNGWLFRTSAVPGDLAPRRELALLVWVLCALSLHALTAPRLGAARQRAARRALAAAGAVAAAMAAVGIVASDTTGLALGYAVLAALAVLGYAVLYRRRTTELRAREASGPPGAEVAALASFLLVPFIAVALAVLATGAYTPRYALPAALGVAMLLPLGLSRLEAGRRWLTAATCVVLVLGVARVSWYQHLEQEVLRDERAEIVTFLERAAAVRSLPVAIAHPQRFFEVAHDPPAGLDMPLLHLSSPELALRYAGTDSTEAGLLVLRDFAPIDVRRFEDEASRGEPFLLLLTPERGDREWVVAALHAAGRTLTPVARDGSMTLVEVR